MSSHPGLLDMVSVESVLYGGNRTGILGDGTSGPNRGLNAIQRRAQQLKKWQEMEDQMEKNPTTTTSESASKKKVKVRFSNETLFMAACCNGDVDEAKRLLGLGTNIDCVNVDGMTAMHQSCIDDNLEMVKFLIQEGADLNAMDNDGWTPLHAASNCGHMSVAEALLEAGADPRIVSNDCELPSDLADTEQVEDLLNKRIKEVDPNSDLEQLRKQEVLAMVRDVNQWTKTGKIDDKPHPRTQARFLHVAASKGYSTVISTLLSNTKLKNQMDLDSLDSDKWSPLAAACYWKQASCVQVLLQFGCDVDWKSPSGQTLEDLCSEDENIIKILKDHRKDSKEKAANKLKEQLVSNGNSKETGNGSTAASPTVTESETQRKAHAKRVRETRRSTQGISADDVSKAKDQIQKQIQTSLIPPSSSTVMPSSPSLPPSTPGSAFESGDEITKQSGSDSSNMSSDRPSQDKSDEQNNNSKRNTSTSKTGSTNCSSVTSCSTPSSVTTSRSPSSSGEEKDPSASGSTSNLSYRTRSSASSSRNSLNKSDSGVISTPISSKDNRTCSTPDFKKLYEEAVTQIETLKKELVQKEQDWNREKRQQQRKMSELEEEVKAIEVLKSDNQRLKDENGALIRVISKLSK